MLEPVGHPPKRGSERSPALRGHLERTVANVRRLTGVNLAFGGPVDSDGLLLNRFSGRVVGPLSGVRLLAGYGVGGKAAMAQRPVVVGDYVASGGITHHYDKIIQAEGLRSMAAVPVVVGRTSVAVVYAALRTTETVGNRVVDVLVHEVRALEQQLAVERALGETRSVTLDRVFQENQHLRASLRDLQWELHQLIASSEDPLVKTGLTRRLREIEGQLVEAAVATGGAEAPHLTRRELDVLTVAATGASNAQVALTLNLTTSTVKSYMKSIMGKFGATTRYEAVNLARRAGLIL